MIKIIIGHQTDNLRKKMLQTAVASFKSNPHRATFLIVPNHIKFTTEVEAIDKLGQLQNRSETSVDNLHILSFSRLAWFLLRDAPIAMPHLLDDAAAQMLLEKIIKQHQDELLLFKKSQLNSGMLKQLYTTLLAIRGGNLDLSQLTLSEADIETKNKIHDLKIISKDFNEAMEGKFATKNELQLQLNQYLAETKEVKDADFYFSDFSHFSLQEMTSVELICQKAHQVTLFFKTGKGDYHPEAILGDYDAIVQQTIKRLVTYLKTRQLSYQLERIEKTARLTATEKLNGLWAQWLLQSGVQESLSDLVQLVKADSRYAEAYFAARTIYQQVALNHYRYRDFLILAPHLQTYETYLVPILKANHIPFFDDLQQQMKYHPLVILIEQLSYLNQYSWRTKSILAIMKTHLIIPEWYQTEDDYQHDLDLLENFVLAHGIDHQLWLKSFNDFVQSEVIRLDEMGEVITRIERLRVFFVARIKKLLSQLSTQKQASDGVSLFFDFLVKNHVSGQLESWREEAGEKSDLQTAQQPEQVWDLMVKLLKDYLLIEPETFDVNHFFAALLSGFKEATFSQIPSTLDAVNLSEMGMVQKGDYKQVFLLGLTDRDVPQIDTTPGFLTTENLAQLENEFTSQAYLEDEQKLHNLDQSYQFGNCLALASDQLYLSYPMLDATNEVLTPSLYYQRIFRLLGSKKTEYCQHDLPRPDGQDVLSFMTNPKASLGYVAFLEDGPRQTLLALTTPYCAAQAADVVAATHYKNKPEPLPKKLAVALYGEHLTVSVSQLESYYSNPFEYFLTYGLKLRPRYENKFDVIQAGNYFHETFDHLVKALQKSRQDLAELSDQQLVTLLGQLHQKMQQEAKYQQLLSEPFNRYLFHRLDLTTKKVAMAWANRLSSTPLRAKYAELSFGQHQPVKGLQFDLKNKRHIQLVGKIDRVDLAAQKDHVLGQVIDYKSSAKKFDLADFANGLSLQMISYLDVLAKNSQFFSPDQPLRLLGAFYQTVTQQVDKINTSTMFDSSLQFNESQIAGEKKLAYNGILVSDPQLLSEADADLETIMKSPIYSGLKVKKNGQLSLPNQTSFTPDQLKLLLTYDEYLIQQAAESILDGDVRLEPFKHGTRTALQYSPYRDVFFFDAALPENQYHVIEKFSKKADFLAFIKQQLERKA